MVCLGKGTGPGTFIFLQIQTQKLNTIPTGRSISLLTTGQIDFSHSHDADHHGGGAVIDHTQHRSHALPSYTKTLFRLMIEGTKEKKRGGYNIHWGDTHGDTALTSGDTLNWGYWIHCDTGLRVSQVRHARTICPVFLYAWHTAFLKRQSHVRCYFDHIPSPGTNCAHPSYWILDIFFCRLHRTGQIQSLF